MIVSSTIQKAKTGKQTSYGSAALEWSKARSISMPEILKSTVRSFWVAKGTKITPPPWFMIFFIRSNGHQLKREPLRSTVLTVQTQSTSQSSCTFTHQVSTLSKASILTLSCTSFTLMPCEIQQLWSLSSLIVLRGERFTMNFWRSCSPNSQLQMDTKPMVLLTWTIFSIKLTSKSTGRMKVRWLPLPALRGSHGMLLKTSRTCL